jgi:two-component system, cell cycle response regulator DivK
MRHILIVDDFKDNREMCAYFLGMKGFRVTQASDGEEALEKAEELLPDLVIMDLSLPGISGWEATRRLRAGKSTGHIPVLILTAHELGSVAPEGCVGVLTKPCMPDEMVMEINRALGQTGSVDHGRKTNARPGTSRKSGAAKMHRV